MCFLGIFQKISYNVVSSLFVLHNFSGQRQESRMKPIFLYLLAVDRPTTQKGASGFLLSNNALKPSVASLVLFSCSLSPACGMNVHPSLWKNMQFPLTGCVFSWFKGKLLLSVKEMADLGPKNVGKFPQRTQKPKLTFILCLEKKKSVFSVCLLPKVLLCFCFVPQMCPGTL